MARPYFLDFALACYANLAIEMYVKLKVITSINQNTPSPWIMRIILVRKSSSGKHQNAKFIGEKLKTKCFEHKKI